MEAGQQMSYCTVCQKVVESGGGGRKDHMQYKWTCVYYSVVYMNIERKAAAHAHKCFVIVNKANSFNPSLNTFPYPVHVSQPQAHSFLLKM